MECIQPANASLAAGFAVVLYFAKGLDPWFGRLIESPRWSSRAVAIPLVGLGAMSYTVYLLHGRLQFLSLQLVRQLLESNTLLCDVAAVSLTLALCIPFFWLCERPFISSPAPRLGKGSANNAPAQQLVSQMP